MSSADLAPPGVLDTSEPFDEDVYRPARSQVVWLSIFAALSVWMVIAVSQLGQMTPQALVLAAACGLTLLLDNVALLTSRLVITQHEITVQTLFSRRALDLSACPCVYVAGPKRFPWYPPGVLALELLGAVSIGAVLWDGIRPTGAFLAWGLGALIGGGFQLMRAIGQRVFRRTVLAHPGGSSALIYRHDQEPLRIAWHIPPATARRLRARLTSLGVRVVDHPSAR